MSEISLTKPLSPPRTSDAAVIARGVSVNILGTLARVIKSIAFIILTRLFGAEVFGLYVLSWSVIDLTSKLGTFGMDKGTLRFVPQYLHDEHPGRMHRLLAHAFVLGFAASLATGTGLFFAAPFIADRIFDKPDMTPMLQALSAGIPFLSLTWIVVGVTRGHKIMRYDAYIKGILEPLIMFGVACALFLIGWRIVGIALAHVVSLVCGTVFALYIFSRFFSWRSCLSYVSSVRPWSDITRFSLPVMGYDLLYVLMIRLDALMVGYFLPAFQVGIYAIAIEIALTTKKVRQWFDPIFGPIIAELQHLRELERLEHNFALVARWILTVNIAFFGMVLLMGKDVLGLFGPEFGVGLATVILLALSQVVYASIGAGDMMLIMSGHPYVNLVNTVFIVIVHFFLNLLLIPTFGMVGAAFSTLVSFGLLTLIRIIEVYHLYRIHPFRRTWWKPGVAGLGALALGAVVSAGLPDVSWLRMGALPLVFLPTYILLLRQFGLEMEDLQVWERGTGMLRRRWQAFRTIPGGEA
ncbi:MAG: flippase [candidate division Zixibacteria bacterium]|nr:flippase [candidate division Zixibacteria bacterium]